MNIFVYSDESGVFDKSHNKYFVFGGVVFLSKSDRDTGERKYRAAERSIRGKKYAKGEELKACKITNIEKGKLFRSLNQVYKFAIIVDQERLMDRIFCNKKDKQRYLDYAYKVGLKRFFEFLIAQKIIDPHEVRGLYVFADEHTTATSGLYELQEGLEQEYKLGTFNLTYSRFFPPVFPDIDEVKVDFCNSEVKTLVRAADIVANKAYHSALGGPDSLYELAKKVFLAYLP